MKDLETKNADIKAFNEQQAAGGRRIGELGKGVNDLEDEKAAVEEEPEGKIKKVADLRKERKALEDSLLSGKKSLKEKQEETPTLDNRIEELELSKKDMRAESHQL